MSRVLRVAFYSSFYPRQCDDDTHGDGDGDGDGDGIGKSLLMARAKNTEKAIYPNIQSIKEKLLRDKAVKLWAGI